MRAPTPHHLAGQKFVRPRLERTRVQRHAVNAAVELRVAGRLQEERRLVPAACARSARERLRLYHVVAPAAWPRPLVPAKLPRHFAVEAWTIPELGHEPVDVCSAFTGVEWTGVRLAGELEACGGELLVHHLEEHVAV